MNEENLFALYEKLYFHELDRREKISARLNLPLIIMAGLVGFLSYMLQNIVDSSVGTAVKAFWALFLLTVLSLVVAAWFFRKSWFGHTDKLLPTANQTESYRQELVKLYAPYPNSVELVEKGMKKYLYDYYMQFSSVNTINNDSRSYNLYRTTVALTISVILSFCTFLPFYIGGLHKPKTTLVPEKTASKVDTRPSIIYSINQEDPKNDDTNK